MKKIIKIVIIIIILIIVLEIINYGRYLYLKNERETSCQVYHACIGPVFYQPVVVQYLYNFFPSLDSNSCKDCAYKPVIYLYPTQTQKVKVKLDYQGTLTADYPAYDYSKKGWEVTAYPDGKIINGDGKEYSYLFWEGEQANSVNYDLSTGFIVKGENTVEFLQNTLSKMGLTPKEYNEFIVYWYPKMKHNKYNLIHFAGDEYTKTAPLNITPSPDSVLRVFMVYKSLDKEISIKSQEIKSFNRTGFSVIEWGGTEVR